MTMETMRSSRREVLWCDDAGPPSAGLVRVSEIARHWAVEQDTARRVLAVQRVKLAADGQVALYAWEDIWRIEGVSHVPPALHEAYRATMIRAEALGVGSERDRARGLIRLGLVDLAPSQLRRRIAEIERRGGPVVRLGPRLRRVRHCDLPLLLDMLTVPRCEIRCRAALSDGAGPDRGG